MTFSQRIVVVAILVLVGCESDKSTLIEPEGTTGLRAGQLVATIVVEQCIVLADDGGALASLCDRTSELRTTPSVVCDETTSEFLIDDTRI